MLTLDQVTHKRLVVARQVYQRAVIQSGPRAGTTDRILALIGFDFAVETALKALILSIQHDKSAPTNFQALVQQCNHALKESDFPELPDIVHIAYVHDLRNDAQHKARYPTEPDLGDCRTYAKDFLTALVPMVWGVSFESISLVSLIQNERVRGHLSTAEQELSEGNFESAIQHSASGMAGLLLLVNKLMFGQRWKPFRINMGSDFRGIYEELEAVQNTLAYVALGMDVTEYLHFKAVVGDMMAFLDGKSEHRPGPEPMSVRNAEYALAYCAETALEMEGRLGRLDGPSGIYRRLWR